MTGSVPLWVPLGTTFLGGLLALSGAFAGPLIERRTSKDEAERQTRTLLLQKAEEIFLELARLRDINNRIAVRLVREELGQKGATDDATGASFETSKLRSLVIMYFPGGAEIFSRHDERLMEFATPIADQLAKKGDARSTVKHGENPHFSINRAAFDLLSELEVYMGARVQVLLKQDVE